MVGRHIQLMVGGAEKSGTSSLKEYLGQHPELVTHRQEEIMYFALESIHELGFENSRRRYFGDAPGVLVGKSVAILYLPEAAARLREHNPDVAIVVVLRNPIDRAYSAYWQARRRGWEPLPTFEEALAAEPERIAADEKAVRRNAYVDRGRYDIHLTRLMKEFPGNVDVCLTEDLSHDPLDVCQAQFARVGVDATFVPDIAERHTTVRSARSERLASMLARGDRLKRVVRQLVPERYLDRVRTKVDSLNTRTFDPPAMAPKTRAALVEEFRPHNQRLADMIGRDLGHWNA